MFKKSILLALLTVCAVSFAQTKQAVPDVDDLRKPFSEADAGQFKNPDQIFFPETWFHFLNGSIGSPEAIAKDLKAVSDARFSGIQFFHGQQGNPADWPGTEEHIECLSPKWESLVKSTAEEAQRLGLRFTMQTCPGWSQSGGPWIKPEQSMRNISWTTTYVESDGSRLEVILPVKDKADWQDYEDLAVLAFPAPKGDDGKLLNVTSVKADSNTEEWTECLNRDNYHGFTLAPSTSRNPHKVDFSIPGKDVVRSLIFNAVDRFNHDFGVDPGIHVRLIAHCEGGDKVILDAGMPMANWQDQDYTMTFALNECQDCQDYTLEFSNNEYAEVSYVRLSTAARKNSWEGEAGWTSRGTVRENSHPEQDPDAYVKSSGIIDLTGQMDADGKIALEVPEGKWIVLRIGDVNTGMRNGPAPAEATGWEVNKFDTECVDFQFDNYVGRLNDGALKGLVDNMLMDSWECKSQTWTPKMYEEFRRVAGYDLKLWFPALMGYVIDDHERTAEFLADWRRTQNDLFVNNFFGRMASNARKKGITVSYETAAGDIFPADPMEYYKYADVPMCEFWQPFDNFLANHNYKPIRPTASAARMYGKPRVSAEAFTSFVLTWDEHLSMLREIANQNLAEGVSHLVFHTYTHNPDPDTYFPGTTFGGGIGTPFIRKQTWWKFMDEFITYLSRCTFMLERGKPVSSVLWFLGDEPTQKPDQMAAFPKGYRYDYVNRDALLTRIDVKDGKWVTPDGISYDVLWIPDAERMLPEVAEKLLELVSKGGILIGNPPQNPATLGDNEGQQERFRNAVNALWNGRVKNGRVIKKTSIGDALRQLGIPTDIASEDVDWCHRTIDGADWYLVSPLKERDFHGTLDINCTGAVQIWNPMDGSVKDVSTSPRDGRTLLNLDLERGECIFVVFRHDIEKKDVTEYSKTSSISLEGQEWTISFPEGWGIEGPVVTNELKAWKDLNISEEGKAFSGTAVYSAKVDAGRMSKKSRYILDLGKVEEIAVVTVNGHEFPALWAAPYRCDITEAIKKGINEIKVEVTSTWFNRLAYDASLPESQRKTWVIDGPGAGSPLRESGLLGPVKVDVLAPSAGIMPSKEFKAPFTVCLKSDEGDVKYGEIDNVIYKGKDFARAKALCNLNKVLGYRICDKNGKFVYSPYTELQSDLLREAKWVTDYARVNGFVYGDAPINPAINHDAKKVSCDRLCSWVLYRLGFTEGQPERSGLVVSNIFKWAEERGFQKITDPADLLPGDIIGVRPAKNGDYPEHVYMYAGEPTGSDCRRYDCGSDKRIQSCQPFTEPLNSSGRFMVAYRPVEQARNTNSK